MHLKHILFVIIISTFIFGCKTEPAIYPNKIIQPDIDWIYQVDSLLMPYWMSEEALGQPIGNFPNYRNNEGKVIDHYDFDFTNIPEPFTEFLIDQNDSLRRNYIRMNSRQIYTYCTAYHITGNEEYLILAKKGLDFLLEHGGYESGSPFTYWIDGMGMPAKFQSTTQDLAYALTGPTMYYYLTRDDEVLKQILTVKNFVITEYFENSDLMENTKLVAWVKEDFENDEKSSKKLLAVLDQLNAYLILLTPILPDNFSKAFYADIKNLSYSLKDNFYDPEHNLFWGDLNNKVINESPTDFGHSIKSFWMLYIAGRMLNDDALKAFAKQNALKLLRRAFLKESGSWAEMYKDTVLTLDKNKSWWSYAELDQMAATLSFNDTTLYSNYLKQTYRYWEENMIDSEFKEVHFLLDEDGTPVDMGLKTCHWKNGFHSLEHALLGYLSTSNYYGKDIVLHFAFKDGASPETNKINPYYYNADIKSIERSDFNNLLIKDLQKTTVIFDRLN